MGAYLNTAKKMYVMALAELEQWDRNKDKVILQEAAEKTWGAVTQASNEIIKAYGRPVPHGTNARRYALEALEKQHRQLPAAHFSERFAAAEYLLHNGCFYEGDCTPDELADWVRVKAKAYLNDVEQLSKQANHT